jgi:hypothetical protein
MRNITFAVVAKRLMVSRTIGEIATVKIERNEGDRAPSRRRC